MFFVLSWTWDKEKIFSPHEELNLRPSHSYALPLSHKDSVVSMANTKLICDSSCELRLFSFSRAHYKMKNIFVYFFTKLKIGHLLYSI